MFVQVYGIIPDGASLRRGRRALIELAAEDLTLKEDHPLARAHVVTQDDLTVGALPIEELHGASVGRDCCARECEARGREA